MDRNDPTRTLSRILICICTGYVTLLPSVPLHATDLVQEAVNKVSLGQYKTYQIDIENMGLGLYGGPDYNQDYRNRDGWRGGGTLGNAEARLYLTDQFISMGLDVFVQGDYANVVAEWPGLAHPNDVYIVCAHYDTTSGGERPGGDDNASGTAGVLEAARILTQYHADATLRFIGFNAEEDWMLGSEDYVVKVLWPSNDNVIGVINLDMILRPGWDGDPQAAIDLDIATGDSTKCLAWVETFIDTAAIYTPALVIDAASPDTTYWYASDQGSFIWGGYPALMLAESTAGEIWSRQSNVYYHSADDASDALANDSTSPSGVTYDYAFATDVVRATVATLAAQAGLVPREVAGFHEYQSIATSAASDLEFFTLGDDTYLAVAQDGNDAASNIDSTLYKWDGGSLVEYQCIATRGARDWEFFTIAGEAYLALANATDGITHLVDSKLFRWNGDRFVEYQALPTEGATDCEFFTVAGVPYLAVANSYDDRTGELDSALYKWDGAGFALFQSLPTYGASDWEFFMVDEVPYLVVANANGDDNPDGKSRIYKWNGMRFVEWASIPASEARATAFFTIDDTPYLGLAQIGSDGTKSGVLTLHQYR